MRIEGTQVEGFTHALWGMRHPYNSWIKSDTVKLEIPHEVGDFKIDFKIGDNDLILAQKLVRNGVEHCKFLRQIQVWTNVTAPRYFWQEADTYKFGTKSSTSTMHKLLTKELITLNDFEVDGLESEDIMFLKAVATYLNSLSSEYAETKDYELVRRAKKLLPESYLQTRLWNTNYAELMNIYHQRKNHRLREWSIFCRWCESLPYFMELCVDPI